MSIIRLRQLHVQDFKFCPIYSALLIHCLLLFSFELALLFSSPLPSLLQQALCTGTVHLPPPFCCQFCVTTPFTPTAPRQLLLFKLETALPWLCIVLPSFEMHPVSCYIVKMIDNISKEKSPISRTSEIPFTMVYFLCAHFNYHCQRTILGRQDGSVEHGLCPVFPVPGAETRTPRASSLNSP